MDDREKAELQRLFLVLMVVFTLWHVILRAPPACVRTFADPLPGASHSAGPIAPQ